MCGLYLGLRTTGGEYWRLRQPVEPAVSGSAAAAHRPGSAASLLIQVEIGLGVVNVHHLDERSIRRIAQANNADCQQK